MDLDNEMRAMVEAFPDAVTLSVAVRDDNGAAVDMRLLYMNVMARGGQPDADDSLGKLCSELWPQMVVNGSFAACMRVLNGGAPASGEFWWTETETYRPAGYDYKAVPIGTEHLLWVLRDSTALVHRLEEDDARFRAAFGAAPVGMALLGSDGRIVLANGSLRAMTDHLGTEIVGTEFVDLLHPSAGGEVMSLLASLFEGNADLYDRELPLHRAGSSLGWARVSLAVVRPPDGTATYCIAHVLDITEQKVLEQALSHQAMHDDLTRLANRALLNDRLSQALERLRHRPGMVAVLMVDIDRFNVVNDGLGHDAGDAVLREVADRLRGSSSRNTTIARFGGDEFVVLCDGIRNEDEAVEAAERVRKAFAEPVVWQNVSLNITVSIGIAMAAHSTSPMHIPPTVQSLLGDADVAMYRAKEQGRDRHAMFDDALRARAVHRMQTDIELQRAMVEKQFRLHYQPVIDLATGGISGAEALIRWEHPERGLVKPDEFIPVAEQSGLIVTLGAWVIDEACRQAKIWNDARAGGRPFGMAVNVSGLQIMHPDLVHVVRDAIRDRGIDPERMVLEITESVLMYDPDLAIRVLRKLKDLGVRISVDDFGTGHSSLTYLKQFPVDILKIDRSFVVGLCTDPEDEAIVSSTIGLAHSLGLSTVAEGVENAAQHERLVALQCRRAQGYFFARPAAAAVIGPLIGRDPHWRTHTTVAPGLDVDRRGVTFR